MSPFKAIVQRWSAISRSVPQIAPARPRNCRLRLKLENLESRLVPSTIVVTSLLDSGRGTLRAAIEKADHHANTRGGRTHTDTIKFARRAYGIISLTSVLPVLSAHIAITGPRLIEPMAYSVIVGPSLRPGTPAFDIFSVANGAVVAISNILVSGGSALDGGGIHNAGSLSLVNSSISNNTASGGSDCYGGAIVNTGTLSITGCSLMNNTAEGAMQSSGGAIQNFGTLSITKTMFGVNSSTTSATGGSSYGGGIANTGTLSITKCTFGSESATGGSLSSGGAIDNSGTLSVASSEFGGNTVTVLDASGSGHGGAIHNSGKLLLTTSTINSSLVHGGFAGFGGAIDNSGTLSVTGASFNGNSATAPDYSDLAQPPSMVMGAGLTTPACSRLPTPHSAETRPRVLTAVSAARSPTRAQLHSSTSRRT